MHAWMNFVAGFVGFAEDTAWAGAFGAGAAARPGARALATTRLVFRKERRSSEAPDNLGRAGDNIKTGDAAVKTLKLDKGGTG